MAHAGGGTDLATGHADRARALALAQVVQAPLQPIRHPVGRGGPPCQVGTLP